MPVYLHDHSEFSGLVRAVADLHKIAADLVEKDYWIMHCLYGLQQADYRFELKGGTSLSKGFNIIHRFSEDIDIRIEPSAAELVYVGKNHDKSKHCESRKAFYDRLAEDINIPGIEDVHRDESFDDAKYRSGGIRLIYGSLNTASAGLKEGILLEVGFDTVTPNQAVTISSWALDFAQSHDLEVIDNRAVNVACYHPGYTFVEKLQAIATKFRKQQETGSMPTNFMRHYYDVYCLLDNEQIKTFIGTDEYFAHIEARFSDADKAIPIHKNEAFLLSDDTTRDLYQKSYEATAGLYYQDQPSFDAVIDRIRSKLPEM